MISSENSLFLIIDIQEKLVKMLENDDIVKNTFVISKACDVLNIPVVVTEQYPKGLGETVLDIKSALSNAKYFEKTSFSALQNEDVLNEIEKSSKKQIIICGIEAHICVLQTAVELVDKGFEVYLLNDCSASRKNSDYLSAVEFLKQKGVKIVNKEIALFMFLRSSKHPNFKELQALIK